MQEFSPIFLNKSCTLTHPQLHFVLLHSIPDIGTYTLIAYCMHFHFEPLNSLSRVISSICSDENISLCNAAKNGPRRAKTGPPTPLKGTYIPISGNVEVNLGLTPSNLCTWVSPLTMDGIISHLCSYLCVYRVLPQSGSHTSASSGCFSEDGSGFQLGGQWLRWRALTNAGILSFSQALVTPTCNSSASSNFEHPLCPLKTGSLIRTYSWHHVLLVWSPSPASLF